MFAMDDLDQKLIDERTRISELLRNVEQAVSTLSVERLAEVLPMISAPLDRLVERVRAVQVAVPGTVISSHSVEVVAGAPLDRALPTLPEKFTRH